MSAAQITVPEFLGNVPYRIWLALGVLALGLVLAYLTGVINRRLLRRAGVPEVIEGTAFERTAREFDTSTVRILATLSSYFIVAVTVLVVGVQTLALVVLLAAYAFAIVLFAALATKDLVASAAAGVFLLLRQPYGIGDEVRVAGERGVVQEVDLFVTHIETDGEEHVLPNHAVFREGIVLMRE